MQVVRGRLLRPLLRPRRLGRRPRLCQLTRIHAYGLILQVLVPLGLAILVLLKKRKGAEAQRRKEKIEEVRKEKSSEINSFGARRIFIKTFSEKPIL